MRVDRIRDRIAELDAQGDGGSGNGDQKDSTPGMMLPPMDSLLRFAIRGWTDAHEVECELGETIPRAKVWMPSFISMLVNPDWPEAYRNYAMRGALLYGGDTALVGCIARAFERPDTRIRMIYELARRIAEAWE